MRITDSSSYECLLSYNRYTLPSLLQESKSPVVAAMIFTSLP